MPLQTQIFLLTTAAIFVFIRVITKIIFTIPTNAKRIEKISDIGKKKETFTDYIVGLANRAFFFLVNLVKNHVKISKYDRDELEKKLARVESKETVETFYAKKVVYFIIYPVIGFYIYLGLSNLAHVKAPIILLLFSFVGIVSFFIPDSELEKQIKEKNERMLKELSRFVRTIWKSPRNKPMIDIVSDYMKIAKSGLKSDIKVLHAEMYMGDEKNAFRNFAARINHPVVNEVVQAIVNIYDVSENKTDDSGDEESAKKKNETIDIMFRILDEKIRSIVMNNVKKELDKRPEKLDMINDMVLYLIIGLNAIPVLISIYNDFILKFR